MKSSLSLFQIYEKLLSHFGKQHWWPAESKFEVIIGAILVQRTTWYNVERAIKNLKNARLLDPPSLGNTDPRRLENLIRPIGFYRQKATRLIAFSKYFVQNYGGSLDKLFNKSIQDVREELSAIKGIGPETADSILLYAAEKSVFPIDTYTKRIFTRLGFIRSDKTNYEESRIFFESNLPRDIGVYKEFRALIVKLGKTYCKTEPKCEGCPLVDICIFS